MGSVSRTARMAVVTGVSAVAWWAAAALPVATAGTGGDWGGAARDAIGAAAAEPAPLVRDTGSPQQVKRGLAAPAMSSGMLSANAKRQLKAHRFLRLLRQNSTADAKCTSRACRTGLPQARDLVATQQAQRRG